MNDEVLAAALERALREGGDFADVFWERRIARSYRLQDGCIREASHVCTEGAGVRVVAGESSGYAYVDDPTDATLLEAARSAAAIARNAPAGETRRIALAPVAVRTDLYDLRDGDGHDAQRAVALLVRADRRARAYDSRIVAVNGHLVDEVQLVRIARSDGASSEDRRPLVTLGVQAIAAANGIRGVGYAADGGRTTLSFFDGAEATPEVLADEASRIALVNLEAREAPAGEMEMIIGCGGGGVLLHEAVGHGLEGDFNRRGTSLYSGLVGERVASELVTIYDDGNLPIERGSCAIDDEGTPTSHTVLVERGRLCGYLQDELNARLMGVAPTGNGRRQSFRHLPQPRMCNTYMPAGEWDVDEIIRSTPRGIYARSFAGGQVEIGRGDFVFMIAEGYLVENGRITAPVKNATVTGNGPEIMRRVVAVGNDARLARRHYTCGKNGQYVPVGVGMPTVKVSSILVGGTNHG